MSPSISKPDPAAFRKYLLGESSEAESASVEAYLESNPDLTPMPVPPGDDTLLACLRGQADLTPVESPQIRRAMEWLKNVGIDSSPEALTNLSDFAADKDTDDAADEVLRLLGKSDASGGFGELGGYRIVRVLGRGGMGVVLEAEDPKLGRRVALKAMRPNIANNATAKQRFLREAKAAAKVENDHIVPIYQVGEDRGILFLAMPYLKGEPLDARLKREQKLPAAEVARIGRQVAEGLAAAHEAGLVHRDIKPANLWLESVVRGPSSVAKGSGDRATDDGRRTTDYRVKILDFGLARLEGPQDVQITGSGTLLGTPAYMAPEQASGKQVDARADLFSLGVVLYRAATGALPFKGDTPMAILTSLALDTPSHASLANLELPTAIGDQIARLLEKNPAKRPTSAQEVAKAFADIQSDLAGDTIPVGLLVKPIVAPLDPWNDIDDTTPSTLSAPCSRDAKALRSGARQPPRKKLLIAGGLLALAAAIAAVVIVIIKDKDGKEVARINVPEGGSFEVKDEGKGKKDGPKPVADADRKAAEWALSIGGTVTIDDGAERKLSTARDLPAGPFTLKEIVVDRNGRVTDASLKKLAGLKSLQVLDLGGTDVTDAGLKELSGLKSIKTLGLWGTQVTDAGLKELAGLQNLELLFLNATKITGTGFKELTGLQSFRTLNLDGVQVTEAGLKELANLKNLEGLSLFGTPLTEAGLKVLAGLQNLQWLNLGGSTVTDAGLKELAGLKNLHKLVLHVTQVSNDGLEHLKDLKALTSIILTQSKITAEGVKKLAAALPYCKIEWDGGTIQPQKSPDRKAAEWLLSIGGKVTIDTEGNLQQVAAAKELPAGAWKVIEIKLDNNKQVTDVGLTHLKTLTNLTFLDLQNSTVSDVGLAHLKTLTKLTFLELQNSTVSNAGLAHLKTLTKLTYLGLRGTSVSDAGLEHLQTLTNLQSLSLDVTSVSDAGLERLKTLTKLTDLHLSGAQVSDTGLEHLKKMTNLMYLNLSGTKVTAVGIETLRKALPNCQIASDFPSSVPDKEKPFVLVRAGKTAAEFKTFAGLRAEMAVGDEIVVHGNGPFDLPLVQLDGIGLTIKAAPGYRPRFRPMTDAIPGSVWIHVANASLRLEGCDFISDRIELNMIHAGGECDIFGCRIAKNSGGSNFTLALLGKRARVADSMILNGFTHGSIVLGPKIAFEFENNVLWDRGYVSFYAKEPGGQALKFSNNTFLIAGILISSLPKCVDIITVEATRNIIECPSLLVAHDRTPANLKEILRWKGRDNTMINDGPITYLLLDERKSQITKLEEWQKYWGEADQGTREVRGSRPFQFDAAWAAATTAERLQIIQRTIAAARPATMKEVGPIWNEIGPGEAYLRALAAAGKSVPKDQLRPEVPEGGPVVVVRDGKAILGYPDIATACDAAADGDTIELRTDKELPNVIRIGSKPRTLTLRAAPGYRPVLNSILLNTNDFWVIEGIHFKGMLNDCNLDAGQIVRLANCSFEDVPSNDKANTFNGRGKTASIEIVNCLIPRIVWISNMKPNALVTVRNSILGGYIGYIDSSKGDQRLELDRCVFWNPTRMGTALANSSSKSVVSVNANGCWFETGRLWQNPRVDAIKWSGNRNVYRLDPEIWAWAVAAAGEEITRLDQLQKRWGGDANSVALDPLYYDRAQWQLLKGAAGQGQGPNGNDLGAKSLPVARLDDPDRKAAEWVLSIGGVVKGKDQDREIKAAADLPREAFPLTWVQLRGNKQVTDADLARFKGCKRLVVLELGGTQVSDAGLAHFKDYTSLTYLGLQGTNVSDAGVTHFKGCRNLWYLNLGGTQVSDAGLALFKDCLDLKELWLEKTKVTATKIDELKKALPRCKIGWDGGVIEPKK